MRRHLITAWLLAWGSIALAQPTSTAPPGLYLGMDIREFAQVYPELAPRSIDFTGHLQTDSLWMGTRWRMDFSFGRNSLSGATCRTPYLNDSTSEHVYRSVRAELNRIYGPAHEFPVPDSTPGVRPDLSWRIQTSQLVLSQQENGAYLLELNSLTRPAGGQMTIDIPLFVGMPLATFAVFHPQVVPSGLGYNGVIERPDQFGEMEGAWQYWFSNNKLTDMFFRANWVEGPSDDPDNWDYVGRYTDQLIHDLTERVGPPLEHLTADSLVTRAGVLHQHSARWHLPQINGEDVAMEILFGQYDGKTGYGYFFRMDYDPVEVVQEEELPGETTK